MAITCTNLLSAQPMPPHQSRGHHRAHLHIPHTAVSYNIQHRLVSGGHIRDLNYKQVLFTCPQSGEDPHPPFIALALAMCADRFPVFQASDLQITHLCLCPSASPTHRSIPPTPQQVVTCLV